MSDNSLDIGIRYRVLGTLWYPNFVKVLKIQGPGNVMFHDQVLQKVILFSDTSRIVQFELDSRFLHFEPNCHYQVSDENPCEIQ